MEGAAVVAGLALLCLAALHPFLQGQMPQTADGELHLFRILALDHALRVDHPLWPRYASGMAFGYGAPLFNYFPPLPYYLPHLLHAGGMGLVAAWLGSMVLYTLAGSVGAWLLGRQWLGNAGAFVTAGAYVYAPYMLFDNVGRGTITEAAALFWLPWVLWAFGRAAQQGRRRDMLLALAVYAFFIPLHNIITLYGTALLGLYCLLLWGQHRERRVFVRLLLAGLLPLLMTAFFWWPALGETSYVRIDTMTQHLPEIDTTRNLIGLGQVLHPPVTADPTQMQQPTPPALGWPQLLLGLVAVAGVVWGGTRSPHPPATPPPTSPRNGEGRKKAGGGWGSPAAGDTAPSLRIGDGLRGMVLLMAAVTVVILYLNTEAAAWFWRSVPLVGYSQFPWRTLGVASLALALLAGAGVELLLPRAGRWGPGVVAGALGIMMLYGMPWVYTAYSTPPAAETISDFQDYERATGFVAASSFAEYLPAWNTAPLDSERLRERFATGDVIARLEEGPGLRIVQAVWRGTGAELLLELDEAGTLVFDWMYMPGWRAAADGQALEVRPSQPEGLVRVQAPAGRYRLTIGLEATALQTQAGLLSLLGAAAAVFVLLPRWLWSGSAAGGGETQGMQRALLVTVALVGLGLFGFKALLLDRIDSPIKRERFAGGTAAGVQVALEADFGRQIVLLGADLPPSPIRAGEALRAGLYWTLAGERIAEDYSSILTLHNAEGLAVVEVSAFMPGGLATSNWQPGYYVQDRLALELPPTLPPGAYTLYAGLYEADTGRRLDFINAEGNPEDVRVRAGVVEIVRAASPAPAPEDALTLAEGAPALVRLEGLPAEGGAGDMLLLRWTWYAEVAPGEDYGVQLLWLDGDETAAVSPLRALVTGYPAGLWQAGDLWDGVQRLYVPGGLETGHYGVALRLVDAEGRSVGETEVLHTMDVRAPERVYTLPEGLTAGDAAWESGLTLVGYMLEVTEADIRLALYWQAAAVLDENLHLFVHLLDEDGRIVEQYAGVPADWTRPTTGWAPGEVVATQHSFARPQGGYRLALGWYDPDSGLRLPLAGGGDSVGIGTSP